MWEPDAAAPSDAATGSDATPRDPQRNCVAPGTPNNERGIGGYCETGSECSSAVGFRLCTSTVGADDKSWFCTAPCSGDEECGAGAWCSKTSRGSGCVPYTCDRPRDAGVRD